MAFPYQYGIEEEFFLTDCGSRRIISKAPAQFFRDCRNVFGGGVSHELLQSQIELVSPILASQADGRAYLHRSRLALSGLAENHGMEILAAGTHPMASWRKQRATRKPRYQDLMDDFQIVAQRNLLCGLHVHVGLPNGIDRIDVMNRLMCWLPLLLAISASSPFWARQSSGLMSYRQAAYDEWPRTGIPDYFPNERSYNAFIDFFMQTGALKTESSIWWAIRPSGRYPTLELRIADACPEVDTVLCIAGLFRALVRHYAENDKDGLKRNEMTRLVNEENRWRAKRYGTNATFIDQESRRVMTVSESLDALELLVSTSADALDCLAAFKHARDIVRDGGSAMQQTRLYSDRLASGDSPQEALIAVTDMLVEQTKQLIA